MNWTLSDLHLLPLGVVLGVVGSIVGLGGGFFIVPYLMMVYDPSSFGPVEATATSLAVVLVNTVSTTVANARRRRIDYRAGFLLIPAILPGAFVGPFLLPLIPVDVFQLVFAGLLWFVSVQLFRAANKKSDRPWIGGWRRRLTESDGTVHEYELNLPVAMVASLATGFFSSMLGVGGGTVLMPALVAVLRVPVHLAAALCQFVLIASSATSTAVNVARGGVDVGVFVLLGLGVLVGGPLGVAMARRIPAVAVKRGLAVIVLLIGAQMAAKGLGLWKL